MMATENLTVTGTQPKSFEELICSPSLADGLKKHASYLSTVNFLLSLTAFLGNSLILVALHKESCPSSAVQTLVSLSGNNWSFDWTCYTATLYHSLDFFSSRRLGSLPICFRYSLYIRLSIRYSIFVDVDGHWRGQTSRAVVGATIQTNCNFKAHVYHCSHLLGCFWCRCLTLHSRLSSNILV